MTEDAEEATGLPGPLDGREKILFDCRID